MKPETAKRLVFVAAGIYMFSSSNGLMSRVVKTKHTRWLITHFKGMRQVGEAENAVTLELAEITVLLTHGVKP